MHQNKLARISALALVFFFISSLSAFAQPPCGCNYCQRFPDRDCRIDGNTTTCLEFLIVALCPAQSATSTNAPSSEEALFAALSEPTQEPAGCLITN